LGVSFPAPVVEEEILKERGIDPASVKGVYIMGVQPGSGAAAAGLKEGDIIQSIDGVQVASSAELSERIARHHPGDKVELTFLRGGQVRDASLAAKLGATFAPVPDKVKQRYGLSSGVYITEVQRGGFFDSAGIPIGTIITRVNGRAVNSLSDINNVLGASRSGMVRLDGITPDGSAFVFNFPLGT
jgi:S1-C subfamily serine protease